MDDRNKTAAKAALAGGLIAAGCLVLPGCLPDRDAPADPAKPVPADPSRPAALYGPAEPSQLNNSEKETKQGANASTGESQDRPAENIEAVYGPAEWFENPPRAAGPPLVPGQDTPTPGEGDDEPEKPAEPES